jgi:arylsulfatase A-like enzyme
MKILVLNATALHLGYLGPYGNGWVATPTLNRLAAEGVVFDQHYADCPGGPRSAWTGRYQFPLPQPEGAPSPPAPELPALLEAAGVPFVHVTDPGPLPAEGAESATPLERTLEATLDAFDQLGNAARYLVWVDLPSLHPPWQVSPDFLDRYFGEQPEEEMEEDDGDEEDEDAQDEDEEEPLTPLLDATSGPIPVRDLTLLERLQGTYAAVVTQLDSGIGLLLQELDDQGLLDGLALVVTSDRGLALGEHEIVGDHRPWLHDELIHLPLILRLPGEAGEGLRVSALTQPVDLLPTLLDLLGLPQPLAHGFSLLPLARSEAEPLREYACAGLKRGEGLEWALRTPQWGLLLPLRSPAADPPRGTQLYVKPDDRWEVNNVLQHHLEFAERLEQTLRGFVEASRRPVPFRAPALPSVEESADTPRATESPRQAGERSAEPTPDP